MLRRGPPLVAAVLVGVSVALYALRIGGAFRENTSVEIRDVLANPRTTGVVAADVDKSYLILLRTFISRFMSESAMRYPAPRNGALLLDIAPQVHEGATPFVAAGWVVHTADLDAAAHPTYVMDITKNNSAVVASASYDAVVCTEVLEHTSQPFDGMRELTRLLRPGGMLFLSVPCNFRLHGPLPDSWRFTEFGVRKLIESAGLELVSLLALEAPNRPLFPIDYAAVARKPGK